MLQILVTAAVLCVSLTSAGLLAPGPLVYAQAGPGLALGHVGPAAIAVKQVGATSYANSNQISVHPALVQVAHAAPVAVQAAPLVVSHQGLGLGLYGH